MFDCNEQKEKVCKGYDPNFCTGHIPQTVFSEIYQDYTLVFRKCKPFKAYCEKVALKRAFRTSGVPAIYEGLTKSDFIIDEQNEDAFKAAEKFLDHKIGGIYFHGGYGTGKTFLASIIANEMLLRHENVLFISVPDLLAEIRCSFNDGFDKIERMQNLAKKIRIISECDTLILDDLGAENNTNWASERMFMIINERYNTGRPMIITSNIEIKQLCYPRIADRLRQVCKEVVFYGESRR